MLRAAVLACAALAATALAVPDSTFSSQHVTQLTEENFDKMVSSGDRWFIKFYAPWCGHCQRLAPAWHSLGDELKETKGLRIGQVDCTQERGLATRFKITSYPSLRYFSPGAESDVELRYYSGPRTLESMLEFATSGWEAAPVRQVGEEPGLFGDLLDFAGRHVVLTVVFFIALGFVLVGVVLLVLDFTGTVETSEGRALRHIVDPEAAMLKAA